MSFVIAVVSGKGGVGKTTISAALSVALSARGKSVLAIDADVGLRNLDLHLGVSNQVVYDFMDVLSSNCDFAKAVVQCPKSSKLFFLAAPQFMNAADIPDKALKNICTIAEKVFDYIVIDCPAGIGRMFSLSVNCADLVLIVTVPDNASIRDAERVAQMMPDKDPTQIRLIVNKVDPISIKRHFAANIDEIIDTVGARLIGVIPDSDAFQKSANSGVPITKTKSKSAISIKNIVARIMGENIKLYKFW